MTDDSTRNTGELEFRAAAALEPWPGLNTRRRFDPEKEAELEASIREKGVLLPLLVHVGNGTGPWVVAGERRLRAAKAVGLEVVPCIVREYTEDDALEVAIVENFQREDISPIEEARGFQRLLDGGRMTQKALAEKLGCSQPHIANRLRLLAAPAEVLDLVEAGGLDVSAVRDFVLPFNSLREDLRTAFYAKLGPAIKKAKGKLQDEEDLQRVVAGVAEKMSKPTRDRYGEGKVHVTPTAHQKCTCGGPAYRYSWDKEVRCFDLDWWNGENGRAAQAAKEREAKAAEKLREKAQSIGTGKVLKESELRSKLGWDGYKNLREMSGELFDPSLLPQESLALAKPEYGKGQTLVCLDMAAYRKAKGAATREKNALVKEKREALGKEDIAAAHRRKIGPAELRILLGQRVMADTLATMAKSIGLMVEGARLDREKLAHLSDPDIELLVKVVAIRAERKDLDSWRDPIVEKVEKQLRTKYRKRLMALMPEGISVEDLKEKDELLEDFDDDEDWDDDDLDEEEEEEESAAADANSGPVGGSTEGAAHASDEADAAAESSERYVVKKNAKGKHEIVDTRSGEIRGARARARDARRYAEVLNDAEAVMA